MRTDEEVPRWHLLLADGRCELRHLEARKIELFRMSKLEIRNAHSGLADKASTVYLPGPPQQIGTP